jgi:acyl-ACP thioesterase
VTGAEGPISTARPGRARAVDFAPLPTAGRVFELTMRPGLADCAPSGRIRLDALARWLQDVAYADVEDAGLERSAVWVLRRNRIRVARFPQFAETFIVRTFCSGLGRMWAERRTTIELAGEAAVEPVIEAVALWVHLDPADWGPMAFTQEELATYGDAAAGRRVSARLRHPAPAGAPVARRWQFRATECDLADHVNNAAYWQPLEEELLEAGGDLRELDAEIEFRTPCQPGEKLILADAQRRWIASPEREIHASIMFRAARD